MNIKTIKQYCKLHRMKLEKITSFGFIASQIVNVRAANSPNWKFKIVAKKREFESFTLHSDGDITMNGKIYERFITH